LGAFCDNDDNTSGVPCKQLNMSIAVVCDVPFFFALNAQNQQKAQPELVVPFWSASIQLF
jgi:hypothetical protein